MYLLLVHYALILFSVFAGIMLCSLARMVSLESELSLSRKVFDWPQSF